MVGQGDDLEKALVVGFRAGLYGRLRWLRWLRWGFGLCREGVRSVVDEAGGGIDGIGRCVAD